jgi:hypothetical protein
MRATCSGLLILFDTLNLVTYDKSKNRENDYAIFEAKSVSGAHPKLMGVQRIHSKPTTILVVLPRLRIRGAIPLFPIRLYRLVNDLAQRR